MKVFFLLFALLIYFNAKAGRKPDLVLGNSISETNQKQIIRYLTSPEFSGRAAGSEQERVYTQKFAALFKKWGLTPALGKSFVQAFEFISAVSATGKNSFEINGSYSTTLTRGVDYQIISSSASGNFPSAQMVFAGFGTDEASYGDLVVTGKWVLLLDNGADLSTRVKMAQEKKACGVIFITDSGLNNLRFDRSLAESTIPLLKMSTKVMDSLLKSSEGLDKNYHALSFFEFKSLRANVKIELLRTRSQARNIIGKLNPPGKYSSAKALIIGAHGDHLGHGQVNRNSMALASEKDKIFFGADDNASGVAGVLELAQYFSDKKIRSKLKRPVFFAIWSAEEIGLQGSAHFIEDWKAETKKDLSNAFEAAFNMDMIGFLRDSLQIDGVASAKEWPGLSEEIGLVSGLPLKLTSDPFLPTDSINFYLAGVPAITFFTGYHKEYHTPRDTFETLNFEGLFKVINFIRLYVEKIADVNGTLLSYVKLERGSEKHQGPNSHVFIGLIPDYAQTSSGGLKIMGVAKDSPAEQVGFKIGDKLVSFAGKPVENIYDYSFALQTAKPKESTVIEVLREGKKLELSVIPVLKD